MAWADFRAGGGRGWWRRGWGVYGPPWAVPGRRLGPVEKVKKTACGKVVSTARWAR